MQFSYLVCFHSPCLYSHTNEFLRYKCPKCRVPYCTVACWKNHQLSCPFLLKQSTSTLPEVAAVETQSLAPKHIISIESRYLPSQAPPFMDPLDQPNPRQLHPDDQDEEEDEDGWKITPEMMQRLNQSEWLRNELRDGGLRRLICDIDSAKEGETVQKMSCKRKRFPSGPGCSAREQAWMDAKATHAPFANFMDRLLYTAGVFVVPQQELNKEDEIEDWDRCRQHLILAPIVKKTNIGLDAHVEEDCCMTREEDDDEEEDVSSSNDDDSSSTTEETYS